MALLCALQKACIRHCYGSRQSIQPCMTLLRTSGYIREMSNMKFVQPLKQAKPLLRNLRTPILIRNLSNLKINQSMTNVKASVRTYDNCKKLPPLREIHTSPNHKAIPPIIWVVIRPILNISVIIFGKLFKKWWRKQPPESKTAFWEKLRRNRSTILGAVGVLGLLGALYYAMHLEYAPVTNRKRFMMLHNKDMEQITSKAVDALIEIYGEHIVPFPHPLYKKVERVMKRLMMANRETLVQQDISKLRIHVIKSTEKNAVVLPNCTVFIFSEIFDLCHNDDQLAAILSHELAHAVLNHQAEQLSQEQVFDTLMLIVLLFVWATFPDAAAVLWQLVSMSMSQLLVKLPFSRDMELEADAVGLTMMAKACFDVREAVTVWGKLSYLDEVGIVSEPPEIVSTHPASKKRQDIMEALIPAAIKSREECNCGRDFKPSLHLHTRWSEQPLLTYSMK